MNKMGIYPVHMQSLNSNIDVVIFQVSFTKLSWAVLVNVSLKFIT